MFAVYAEQPNLHDPISALRIGERPLPDVPDGWARVRMTHASLNRHDIFTLQGITGHPQPLRFPMILGNDGAGMLDDGTEVVIYPLISSADWKGDETLGPGWHIPSEFVQGTFAEYT